MGYNHGGALAGSQHRGKPPRRAQQACATDNGILIAAQIGVIVGLASTCIQSIGLTLQRKSHLLEEEKDEDYERRPPYKRRRSTLR